MAHQDLLLRAQHAAGTSESLVRLLRWMEGILRERHATGADGSQASRSDIAVCLLRSQECLAASARLLAETEGLVIMPRSGPNLPGPKRNVSRE